MPVVRVRLGTAPPFDAGPARSWLAARAVPEVEVLADGDYARSLAVGGATALVRVHLATATPDGVDAVVSVADAGLVPEVVSRLRRLLDLDCDPPAVGAVLRRDPALRPSVDADPGLRVMGTVDPVETALRAVIGQRISVAAARSCAARLAARLGPVVDDTGDARFCGVRRAFPTAGELADADLSGLGLAEARQRTLRALAGRIAAGTIALGPGADPDETARLLVEIPGIGPWTAAYVALRALGDRDAFPVTDLGIVRGARRLGLPTDAAALSARAERWRPWRAYAAHHIWAVPPPP